MSLLQMMSQAFANSGGGGGGGGNAPVILFTDAPTVPTTGGENGNGGYLSIFGRNFDLAGIVGGSTKVFFGGVQVAAIKASTATPIGANPILNIQQIDVQLGNAAGIATGTAAALQVTTAAGSSNTNITAVPSGGHVMFVSQSGNNGTFVVDDITHPARNIQLASNANAVTWKVPCHAGDQVVVRGGAWSEVGLDNAWWRVTNSVDEQGTALQRLHFRGYPGESVVYTTPTGTPPNTATTRYRGGIQGPASAQSGFTGSYFCLSNMTLNASADSAGDAAPVNAQSAQIGWCVTNMAGSWPSTATDAVDGFHAKGGMFSGHPKDSRILLCKAHDFYCDQGGASENHGFYTDSPLAGAANPQNMEFGWNWALNITGGNGQQFFDNVGNAAPGGWLGFTGCTVHDCIFDTYGKYGLNLAQSAIGVYVWSCVFLNGIFAPIRVDFYGDIGTQVLDIQIEAISTYNCDQQVSGSGNSQVLVTHTGTTTGQMKVKNSILCAGPSTTAGGSAWGSSAGGVSWVVFDSNLVYGPSQTTPWGAGSFTGTQADAHLVVGDPKYTTPASGDLSLQATSPAIDSAVGTFPVTVPRDLAGLARVQGTAQDIGAFEFVNNKPYNTVAPTFGGTEQVTSASTVTNGTWGNSPTSYAYQWFTATTAGGTPNNISGATGSSYTWQAADAGLYGGCTVTATNTNGSTAKNAYVGGTVAADPRAPQNTAQPSISGTGGIGNLLTRVAGTWTNSPTLTYQWRRNGANISGATGTTYTQVTADDSAILDLVETGTNGFGSNAALSSNSITVPHVAAAPTLVGSATPFTSGTNTVSVSVQIGDYVSLGFSANNDSVSNMVITDNLGGANTDWVLSAGGASGGGGSIAGGVRTRKMTQAGTLTVSISTVATYAAEAIVVHGVDPSTQLDGVTVSHTGNTSPMTATPTTTTYAKDLILEFIATIDSNWNVQGTKSDTFYANNDQHGLGRGLTVQSRTTSSAAAQAAMTVACAGGTSGTDLQYWACTINFKGH